MKTAYAEDAVIFGAVVADALADSGGFDHVRRAERDPTYRDNVAELLATLGLWDIDPTSDEVQLEAAALACRAAGRFALPYPVAERLAAAHLSDCGALAVVSGVGKARVSHGDLDLRWRVTTLDGRVANVTRVKPATGGKLGCFVHPVELNSWDRCDHLLPLVLTLQNWTLLGMFEEALTQTRDYVCDREQFGRPLISFQSVSFALTEIKVATQSLEELSKYTLWSVARKKSDAVIDALALRAAAYEAADTTFRVAHQLHGATGFCDETPVSWLSRYSQSLKRIPLGRSQTEHALAEGIRNLGFFSPMGSSDAQ